MTSHRKTRSGVPASYFLAEAAGLRWLTTEAGPPVVEVLACDDDALLLERVAAGTPTPEAAVTFGAALARLHDAGAPSFGAPPPGAPPEGWIADLPMPYGDHATFGPMFADLRVRPYVVAAERRGVLTRADRRVFDELCEALRADEPGLVGPPESAARLHGDLWHGNVLWSHDRYGRPAGWLIDPAAHGGHRESDLAMLALFGAPFLAEIMRGYESVHALGANWRSRVPLHQVYPLLVHAVLFGGGYPATARAAAEQALRSVSGG